MVMPLGDTQRTLILPIATYVLITLNVVMYLVQLDRGPRFTTSYAATPFEITHGEDITQPFRLRLAGAENPLDLPGRAEIRSTVVEQGPVPFPVWMTLFTAMFLHGSPLHLAGNMLFLWIFGDNVEEVLGTLRYVLLYLLAGLAGSLAQIVASPDSYIPTLGASGAIAGLMGAYLVWFPHHGVRVLLLRVIVILPAWVVIGFWIASQIWMGLGSVRQLGEVGGVAYLAHIGGAAVGVGVGLLCRREARALAPSRWDVGPGGRLAG